jgi:hypothetical protein
MPRRKSKDAERVAFIAPLGNRALYEEVPALEGLPVDSWIRETLSREAARVLAANERDSREVPPAHFERPPRVQARLTPEQALDEQALDDQPPGDEGPRR